jgi:hypothetical protein
MNRENSEFEKSYKEERDRFESDIEAWEWCYERFKSKIDKIAEYERKVERLEAELRDRDRLVDLRFKEEKNNLIILMVIFVIASIIFVKVTAQSQNVWAYFIAGLLIGVGWTVIIKLVTKSGKTSE